jgi:TM2 domain-containing membrane protein YozV
MMRCTCNRCQGAYEEAEEVVQFSFHGDDQSPAVIATEAPLETHRLAGYTAIENEPESVAMINKVDLAPNPKSNAAGLDDLLPVSRPKSPVLAAFLSFLLVGMGQIYLGQVEKGLSLLGIVLLLIMSARPGPLGIVLLVLNVIDAFFIGRKVKRGQQIRKWQFCFQPK